MMRWRETAAGYISACCAPHPTNRVARRRHSKKPLCPFLRSVAARNGFIAHVFFFERPHRRWRFLLDLESAIPKTPTLPISFVLLESPGRCYAESASLCRLQH